MWELTDTLKFKRHENCENDIKETKYDINITKKYFKKSVKEQDLWIKKSF